MGTESGTQADSGAAVDLSGVCGLLLTGGPDIHPRHWDSAEPVHPTTELDEPRDDLEVRLVRAVWEAGLPILGICRGIQMLNAALGGSLTQDIPSACSVPLERHRCGSAEEPILCHDVQVEQGTRLAALLGMCDVPVNSRHHQAVRQVGAGLRAVGWDRDTATGSGSLIEGLEAVEPGRWVVGVQWHPENLVDLPGEAGEAARVLFRGFAQALADS